MNKVLLLSILVSSSADCMNFSYVKSIGFGIARSSMGISHAYVRSVGLAQSTLSQSVRFYRKKDHSLKLEYVSVDKNGLVTISQPDYPKSGTVVEEYLKDVEGPFYDKSGSVYYIDNSDFNENDSYKLRGNINEISKSNSMDIAYSTVLEKFKISSEENVIKKREAILSKKKIPLKIVKQSRLFALPYAACGKLTMKYFINQGKLISYKGSAFLIDKNIVMTAAHNVYSVIEEVGKTLTADQVYFKNKSYAEGEIGFRCTHCYIHPKWIESNDQSCDMALLFFQHSIKDQLKLMVNQSIDKVKVIGYPEGHKSMHESHGDAIYKDQLIIHTADTLPGNSGSPIILRSNNNVIGVHTAYSDAMKFNNGYGVNNDTVKFINKAITLYNKDLKIMKQPKTGSLKVLKSISIAKKVKLDYKIIQIVKNLLADHMPINKIATITGVSKSAINNIKAKKK
ncbi:trypsin-like serine peptidase [Candidatus Cytomitobacter primus]|uniref:Serine protease n=1 Tax=Candidatus Cytomitobacter primus TaxID=2066024 RepID=A0A5C0UG25_9PROT|nr:trypsin-like peptidase domain-containing protein [Candidatus Cytomitobacter primus]QEK38677.1 trypsin-like serine protease [Candidatus Cytomitobacter primus]